MAVLLKQVFIGSRGLRAGWRFAAFAALWYWLAESDYGLNLLAAQVYHFSDTAFVLSDLLVYDVVGVAAVLTITALFLKLEKRRWPWVGLPVGRNTLSLFGSGCLWGGALASLLLLAAWTGGHVTFRGLALHGAEFFKYAGLWLIDSFVGAGFGEEMVFRGYAQAALVRGMGFWPAALVLSSLFGGIHLEKPMEDLPDILNIVLFGLFCAYSVRRTGSLWFAIGFHGAFDYCALSVFGSPNTLNGGLPLENHLLDTNIGGPAWLTGGPQGLEASWLVPLLLAAMFLLLRKLHPQDQYPPERD